MPATEELRAARIRCRRIGYARGTRVRAVEFSNENSSVDDNEIVPPGTMGTVTVVDDWGTVHVKWDNGAQLGCLLADQIERVAEQAAA